MFLASVFGTFLLPGQLSMVGAVSKRQKRVIPLPAVLWMGVSACVRELLFVKLGPDRRVAKENTYMYMYIRETTLNRLHSIYHTCTYIVCRRCSVCLSGVSLSPPIVSGTSLTFDGTYHASRRAVGIRFHNRYIP